jgi:hypothetical protein
MQKDNNLHSENESNADAGVQDARPLATRRSFLKDVGRKAIYVTPVVMTFAASEARAGSATRSWCGEKGSPCAGHSDCCPEFMCLASACEN